jgi:hypothetical protein
MPPTLHKKIEAEHRLRQLLRDEGLPQPDEVEYGFACVRFLYHQTKTCIVVDLDPAADDGDSGDEGVDEVAE